MKTARELMGNEWPGWVDSEPGSSSVEWLLETVAQRAREEYRDDVLAVIKKADDDSATCEWIAGEVLSLPVTGGQ